ncbi:MAG TPA: alpha/beta hydrolase-fold protein [Steroidobacteraceae bacterium]|nr:alpha/beta hydrolase-fold protein [Steroidobacteraceae bacterium]
MQVRHATAADGSVAPVSIVMLPPAYAAAADFEREGFAAAVRARSLALDLAFVAPELRHATDRAPLEQLRAEIIVPARAQGVAVWLAGISLGGYLALCYAAGHAEELAGLCLFAPYLGSHLITGEIERAGGLAGWRPGEPAADDEERRVWSFIAAARRGALPIHLGLGREDRFARRHRLLAAALAGGQVDTVSGGHDWPTWHRLWENFLDARFLPAAGA